MSIFALVDCNNFYASCERVFNPSLLGKPIVVLSNNDGCVIARSNEAEELGIPMGAPYYQHKSFIQKNNVKVFSSNYQFYGDLSQRVMKSLSMMLPNQDVEVYSIDEAFLRLDGFVMRDLFDWALGVRNNVLQWTGIPTSIGIAPTKTLSKIANRIAKKHRANGIFDIHDSSTKDKIISDIPVEDIWGISYRWGRKLRALGISSALELKNTDTKFIRNNFSIVLERIVYELRGLSCIDINLSTTKKSIGSSKSFGKLIIEIEKIEEAISNYAARACEKLRTQKSKTNGIYVFLKTNPFRKNEPQYQKSATLGFDLPTSDTGLIIRSAKNLIKRIYDNRYRYHKCGIILLDLVPENQIQSHLFIKYDEYRKDNLMKVLDNINKSMGRKTIFHASQGIKYEWETRRNKVSQHYTTKWEDLPKIY